MSWQSQMLGQCALPGRPPLLGDVQSRLVKGDCGCDGGCGGLKTQPLPDINGMLRAFYGCGSEDAGAMENPCVCGPDFEGIHNVFILLDWIPVSCSILTIHP
jgi:hypothetical protein